MNCADGTIARVGDIVIRKRGGRHLYNVYGVVIKHLPRKNRYRVMYTHVDTVYDKDPNEPVIYTIETPTKQYCLHDPGIILNNRGKHVNEGQFSKWNGKPVKYATREKDTH